MLGGALDGLACYVKSLNMAQHSKPSGAPVIVQEGRCKDESEATNHLVLCFGSGFGNDVFCFWLWAGSIIWPDVNTYFYTNHYADADGHTDTDSNADTDSHTDTDSNTNTDSHTDADSHNNHSSYPHI